MPTLEYTLLGPVILSRNLRLRGLLTNSAVTWEHKRTLGGVLKSRPAHSIGGQKLILDGEGNHFTAGQIMRVKELIQAAQPVLLVHHLHSAMVLVEAVLDGASLAIDYADYNQDDWVNAKIELTEI